MRIVQVMLAKGFGGAERSFVDISRALAARGHTVMAIGEARGVALRHLADTAGIECVPLRCLGAWDRLAGHRISRHIAHFRPAIVQAHLARAALLAGRAAAAQQVPSLAKTHNLVNVAYYRYLDCLVPTTAAQRAHLLAAGVAAARIETIPNFTAIGLQPVSGTHAVSKPPVIKALGRMVHKKGFDLLIEAVALLQQRGVYCRVEIAGDGPEKPALAQQLQHRGVADHVSLVGWVDAVAAFLADADLLVVPSRDEPFGIVLIEAMAAGVPVLATRTQGPLEILTDGSGYLTAVDDSRALADSIEAALSDPAREAVRHTAQQRFAEHYSADTVLSRYLALYERLIAQA